MMALALRHASDVIPVNKIPKPFYGGFGL